MNHNPLVSVIVPIYNMENYLKTCLESIANQTYGNIEVLLIDDGSTDSSYHISKEFTDRDSRFKLFSKENGGVSSARNFGLDRALGEFISFIDPDDWVEKDYIEFLYAKLVESGADISIGGRYNFDEEEQVFYYLIFGEDSYYEEVFDTKTFFKDYYVQKQGRNLCFTASWGKLIRRELLNHLRFPLGRDLEDGFFTYKLYLKAKKIIYSNKALYAYRVRNGSLSRVFTEQSLLDIVEFMEEKISMLTYLGYDVQNDLEVFYNMLASAEHNGRISGLQDTEAYRRAKEKLDVLNLLK